MGRSPACGRSARPRTGPCCRRCSGPSLVSAVELRPEENRCGLEDLIGPTQLPVLLLELGHAPALVGGESGAAAGVDLFPLHPLAQRLDADAELGGDLRDD